MGVILQFLFFFAFLWKHINGGVCNIEYCDTKCSKDLAT